MGAIVVIFVSFGKVQSVNFFDEINFENFLLIEVYIQNLKYCDRELATSKMFESISAQSRCMIRAEYIDFKPYVRGSRESMLWNCTNSIFLFPQFRVRSVV